jgi:hypothetical protein
VQYKTTLSGLCSKEIIADVIWRDDAATFKSEITWLARTAEQIQFGIEVWHHEYDLYIWNETNMFNRPATGQFKYSSNAIVTLRDWRITRWASPGKAGQLGCEITIEHLEYDICARTVSKALQKLLAPGLLIVDPTDAYWDRHRP